MKIDSMKKLKQGIREIPIEEAIDIRAGALNITRRGRQTFGLCPFHSDEKQGNFAFGGPHNGFKCFACGESGDIINLVMKLDDIDFKGALLKIAVELELLTQHEADDFHKNGSPAQIKQHENTRKFSSEQSRELSQIQIEQRHAVYSLLAEGDAIVNPVAEQFGIKGNQKKLSAAHYAQLKNERGLTDKQIEETGFFTLREDYQYLPVIYRRLFEELRYPPNTLNVPGFWRFEDGFTIDHMKLLDGTTFDFEMYGYAEQYFWYFEPIDALGIPIRDEDENIIAIQLRPDDSEHGGKYVWLSSSYADGKNKKIDGASPGAQQDVTLSEKLNRSYVFITEGKFKSLAIAEAFKVPSISLQGVNTYQNVSKKIEKLNEKQTKAIDTVFIAYDADMAFNHAVIKAVVDLANKELIGYEVFVAVWDYKLGKGIDDLILNGYQDALVRLSIDELNVVKDELNKRYPMTKTADKAHVKEQRERFFYDWLAKQRPEVRLHPSRMV